jgi:hypothetical protein
MSKWGIVAVRYRETDPTLFLCSYEAWFRLRGLVNSQSNRFCTFMYEVPLHDVAIVVWRVVSATGTLGSVFMSHCTRRDFLHTFRHQFFERESMCVVFSKTVQQLGKIV